MENYIVCSHHHEDNQEVELLAMMHCNGEAYSFIQVKREDDEYNNQLNQLRDGMASGSIPQTGSHNVNMWCEQALSGKQTDYMYSKFKDEEVIGKEQMYDEKEGKKSNEEKSDSDFNPCGCAMFNDIIYTVSILNVLK